MSQSLVEIPFPEWPQLAELYAKRRQFTNSYYLIWNFCRWPRDCPDFDVEFLSLDGDWRSDGTFLCKYRVGHAITIFCNTLAENTERLTQALNCLQIAEPYDMFDFSECLKEAIVKHYNKTGRRAGELQLKGSYWYNIGRDKIDQFVIEPPRGIHLECLKECHAEQINCVWPLRYPDSVLYVRQLIRFNLNVGAFDEDGNLLAWCLMLPIGCLGVLQVEVPYKRMGLGSLVVRQLAKWFAAEGMEVSAPVFFENTASRAMFEKVGFEIIDKVFWAKVPAIQSN